MYITCTVKIVTDTAYTLKSRLEHGKFHSLIRCKELLYTGLFSPRVIFVLLQLETVFPIWMSRRHSCVKIDNLRHWIRLVLKIPIESKDQRGKNKERRILSCTQYNDYLKLLSFLRDFSPRTPGTTLSAALTIASHGP